MVLFYKENVQVDSGKYVAFGPFEATDGFGVNIKCVPYKGQYPFLVVALFDNDEQKWGGYLPYSCELPMPFSDSLKGSNQIKVKIYFEPELPIDWGIQEIVVFDRAEKSNQNGGD